MIRISLASEQKWRCSHCDPFYKIGLMDLGIRLRIDSTNRWQEVSRWICLILAKIFHLGKITCYIKGVEEESTNSSVLFYWISVHFVPRCDTFRWNQSHRINSIRKIRKKRIRYVHFSSKFWKFQPFSLEMSILGACSEPLLLWSLQMHKENSSQMTWFDRKKWSN